MKETILVVDDEPAILRLIDYQLQSDGYEVLTARTGAEALRLIEGQLPDLMILDVMMPDMSGIQVCQALRSQPKTAELPVILLSARAQVNDKITGLHAGADDYVTKPVEMTELIARVEALLSRSRRLRNVQPVKQGRVVAFMGVKGGGAPPPSASTSPPYWPNSRSQSSSLNCAQPMEPCRCF